MAGFADLDDDVAAATGESFSKEQLPDGEYTVEVEKGESKEVKKAVIVTLYLKLLDGGPKLQGRIFQHQYWLVSMDGSKSESQINQLKKDLNTIGFNLDAYHEAGQKFSMVVGKTMLAVNGMKLAVKKSSKVADPLPGKAPRTFHNVYVNKRLPEDGKPTKVSLAELEELAKAAAPADPF